MFLPDSGAGVVAVPPSGDFRMIQEMAFHHMGHYGSDTSCLALRLSLICIPPKAGKDPSRFTVYHSCMGRLVSATACGVTGPTAAKRSDTPRFSGCNLYTESEPVRIRIRFAPGADCLRSPFAASEIFRLPKLVAEPDPFGSHWMIFKRTDYTRRYISQQIDY